MVTWLLETFFWVTTMSSKFVTSVFQKISIQVPIIRSLLILHCLLNGWHWRLWITGCTLIVEFVISLLQVSCNSISLKLIKLTWHLPWHFVPYKRWQTFLDYLPTSSCQRSFRSPCRRKCLRSGRLPFANLCISGVGAWEPVGGRMAFRLFSLFVLL